MHGRSTVSKRSTGHQRHIDDRLQIRRRHTPAIHIAIEAARVPIQSLGDLLHIRSGDNAVLVDIAIG